jgi:hypothetical protein
MLTVVVRVVADTEEYDVTPVVRFRVNVDWLNWVVSSVTVVVLVVRWLVVGVAGGGGGGGR